MSGLDLIEELVRRRMLAGPGTTDFLEKPFSIEQLRAAIERWRATLAD